MRFRYVYQPRFKKVTYGKNTFKYYSTHIWILLPMQLTYLTTYSLWSAMHELSLLLNYQI